MYWNRREHWPERVRLQREWIAAEFAWENIASRVSDIYARLLADRPVGRAWASRALRQRPRRHGGHARSPLGRS